MLLLWLRKTSYSALMLFLSLLGINETNGEKAEKETFLGEENDESWRESNLCESFLTNTTNSLNIKALSSRYVLFQIISIYKKSTSTKTNSIGKIYSVNSESWLDIFSKCFRLQRLLPWMQDYNTRLKQVNEMQE